MSIAMSRAIRGAASTSAGFGLCKLVHAASYSSSPSSSWTNLRGRRNSGLNRNRAQNRGTRNETNRRMKLKIGSSRREPIALLKKLKEVQDPDTALEIFYREAEQGYRHDYPTYCTIIYKLGRAGKFEAVEALLDQIKSEDIKCNDALFNAVMQHYGKACLMEEAISIFHRIPEFNCRRSRKSFNVLLDVLVDGGWFLKARQLFECSENLDRLGCARQLFDKMSTKGIAPSTVTYNILIGFFCKKGVMSEAMKLLDEMVKNGASPNVLTYSTLMEGLCNTGKFHEARKLMYDMSYRDCKPTVVTYSVLLTDLCKGGKLEEAMELLEEMRGKGCRPDVVRYAARGVLAKCGYISDNH